MIPLFSLKKKQFFLPLHMNSERRLLMFISIVCVCGYICNGRTKKVVFHSITFLVVIVVVLCIWISGTHVKTSISCVFQLSSNDTIRQNERNRKKTSTVHIKNRLRVRAFYRLKRIEWHQKHASYAYTARRLLIDINSLLSPSCIHLLARFVCVCGKSGCDQHELCRSNN